METLRWRARAEEAAGIYRSASHYYKIGGMNDDVLMCLCDEREKGGGSACKGRRGPLCVLLWMAARACVSGGMSGRGTVRVALVLAAWRGCAIRARAHGERELAAKRRVQRLVRIACMQAF